MRAVRSHVLPKAWAQVHGDVLVSFFETIVLANVVKIITADDDCSCHLEFHHCTGEDTSTNAHVAGERTFLVDVGAFGRLGEEVRRELIETSGAVAITSRGVLKPKPMLRV